MVLLDRALVSFYRLSIVTMPLTEAVWPRDSRRKHLGCSQYPRFGGMVVRRGSKLVPRGSGRATLFLLQTGFWQDVPFSHNTYVTQRRQTDRRQTDTISCHKRDR